MKLINSSLPTLTNNLAQPWTAGSINFTYQSFKELSVWLATSLILTSTTLTTLTLTTPYALYGCNVQAISGTTLNISSGLILFNNELFFFNSGTITYPGTLWSRVYGILTTSNSPTYGDPTAFNDTTLHSINNDRTITPMIATSSTGIPALPATAFIDLGNVSPFGPFANTGTVYVPNLLSQATTLAGNAEFNSPALINTIGNSNGASSNFFYPTYGQQWVNQTSFLTPWSIGAQQPRYIKEYFTGRVQLNGLVVTTGSAASNTIIFTLPVGYRPTQYCQFACLALNVSTSTYYTQFIIVRVSGTVEVIGNIFPTGINWIIDLSAISFIAF